MINRCDKKVKFEIELQGDGYTIFKVIWLFLIDFHVFLT
jgi:hypothetical protein